MKGIKPLEPLEDMGQQMKAEEKKLQQWARLIGVERAQAVMDYARGFGKLSHRTLPELIAEKWLADRGMRYRAQYPLVWAKPDFIIFGASDVPGAMVWEIQGEYWHGQTQGRDQARKERLLASVIEGMPVMAVVELWEKDIYQNENVFNLAIQGVNSR